jgi:hypothetical protein
MLRNVAVLVGVNHEVSGSLSGVWLAELALRRISSNRARILGDTFGWSVFAFATTIIAGFKSYPADLKPLRLPTSVVVPLPFQGSSKVESSGSQPEKARASATKVGENPA